MSLSLNYFIVKPEFSQFGRIQASRSPSPLVSTLHCYESSSLLHIHIRWLVNAIAFSRKAVAETLA